MRLCSKINLYLLKWELASKDILMKTIGLIGGMSYQSTITYYKAINEEISARLGGLNSAKCVLYSVNFNDIEPLQRKDKWEEAGKILLDAANSLRLGGADFIVLCTNTMHKVAPAIKEAGLPLLHIATATADEIKKQKINKIALLGTRYTMTQDFYTNELKNAGLDVILPKASDIDLINDVIFSELCKGVIKESSKHEFMRIIDELGMAGAGGVILGCTEIGLLVKNSDTKLKIFDTTLIHAKTAVNFALE